MKTFPQRKEIPWGVWPAQSVGMSLGLKVLSLGLMFSVEITKKKFLKKKRKNSLFVIMFWRGKK